MALNTLKYKDFTITRLERVNWVCCRDVGLAFSSSSAFIVNSSRLQKLLKILIVVVPLSANFLRFADLFFPRFVQFADEFFSHDKSLGSL